MINIISSELYKIIKSKIFYGVLIIFLAMNFIAFILGIKEKLNLSSSEAYDESIATGISIFQSSFNADGFIYVILVFTVFLITSEYINKSIRQMACHGIARWKLALGQYIAISSIITIVVLGFGYISLFIFTILFELGSVDIASFLRMNLGLICIVWTTSSLGVLISHLIRNMGIAMIASLILVPASNLFTAFISVISKNDNLKVFSFTNIRKAVIDFTLTQKDFLNYFFILILISIISIILSILLFSKRDID